MRFSRQNKILEIIESHDIETQEELVDNLRQTGYDVTQATVSRDIRELSLVKIHTSGGKTKYAISKSDESNVTDRTLRVFADTVLSVTSSNNIVVIKTLIGCANAACESIDMMNLPNILGTIAGDNTIFIVCDSETNIKDLVAHFQELLH